LQAFCEEMLHGVALLISCDTESPDK
jgi:hypothetical protein